MSDTNETQKGYERVYQDTLYFVNALVDEYSFYNDVFKMVNRGKATIEIKKKHLIKTIDEAWILAIEKGLPYLDKVIRTPGKDIEEKEEVLPVEMTHHITSRSVKYLAQHTNMINKIEENGDVIPSKLLNVYRDETLMTYENKFVNTLIQRLYLFVSKRYVQLLENSESENCTAVEFQSDFLSAEVRGKSTFRIELSESDGTTASAAENSSKSMLERIQRINGIITAYQSSEFAVALGKSYINPPVMHTNMIMKNPDLYACLQLWEFIETYDDVGYEIRVEESAEKPREEYIKELYSMLALQYVIFRYNVSTTAEQALTLDSRVHEEALRPRVITEFQDIDADDFSVYDAKTRKMVPLSQLSARKRLTGEEKQIRDAIDIAIAADRAIIQAAIDEERRKKAEELEEKRAAAKRLREEKARLRAEEKERKKLEKQLLKKNKNAVKTVAAEPLKEMITPEGDVKSDIPSIQQDTDSTETGSSDEN